MNTATINSDKHQAACMQSVELFRFLHTELLSSNDLTGAQLAAHLHNQWLMRLVQSVDNNNSKAAV
jgi:hypothetical protein